jgi:hypothetical protein
MTKDKQLQWRFLQFGSFFWDDRTFYWANLDTYAAVNTGSEVNPVPISAFDIFAWAIMDTSDWTGIYAIRNTFTDISNNCMCHNSPLSDQNCCTEYNCFLD